MLEVKEIRHTPKGLGLKIKYVKDVKEGKKKAKPIGFYEV